MFGRVKVKHEINQRPLQSCSVACQNGKSGTGNFRRAIEIENAETLTKVPMRLGWNREGWRRPPTAHLDVVFRTGSCWNGLMGKIGNPQRDLVDLFFDEPKRRFHFGDALTKLLHGGHGSLAGQFLPFQPGDFIGTLLQICSEVFHLDGQTAPLLKQFTKSVPLDVAAAGSESTFDLVQIIAEVAQIVHERRVPMGG
jgi:hypothetical protein